MSPHLLFLGALFLLLGYLVGVRKQTWLLSGFNQHRVRDKDRLARLVGGYTFLAGTVLVAIGLVNPSGGEAALPIAVAGFIALLVYVNMRMVE